MLQPFLVCVNRKRKELVMKKGQIVEGIIERVDFPNKGILRTEDGTRVIVKNAIMGQKVSAAVNKVRKGKCEGRLLEILEKSAENVTVHTRHSQKRVFDALRCFAAHFCS